MNRVLLTGNLVLDIKPEKTKNGKLVLKNRIAVKDGWNTKYEKTYFINLEAYGKDNVVKFKEFKKGSLVEVEGKLVVENYKDKNGNWQSYTKVVVFEIRPIEFRNKNKEITEEAEVVDWDNL